MKKMKKIAQKNTKIKKILKKNTLLEEMSHEEKTSYNTAILEEMRENFRAFGQELVALHSKTDVIFEEVGMIKVELSDIKIRIIGIENRLGVAEESIESLHKEIKGVRLDVGMIKEELKFIKAEISDTKKVLTTKADMKYISLFEVRVARLEKKI